MATRIPLVLNGGQIEQLQTGDALAPDHQPIYWQIIAGETIEVGARQQYAVFGRLDLQGTLSLAAGAELAVYL
jgi:hypothetical protein